MISGLKGTIQPFICSFTYYFKGQNKSAHAGLQERTFIQRTIVCNRLQSAEPCPCLAERICHCAVKTCHPPRAHCHLQNENQKKKRTKKKRKKERNPDILYMYILMSARFYLHTMGGKWFISFKKVGTRDEGRGRKKKEEEEWSVRPLRKEVWGKKKSALNYSPLRWLISIEAPGQSGSFSMRVFPFHLNRGWRRSIKSLSVCK